MRGFIGNDKALKAALGFGVDLNGFSGGLGIAAKMVKDSSKQAVKKGVRGFTGKTECAWHPPPRHEMRAAAPRQFPPHEARHAARADEFGDLSKAAANKVGDAIAVGSEKVGKAIKVGVTGFTGKQEYEFGDVSKAAAKKVGGAIAVGSSKVGEAIKVGVSGFTGKQEYELGDLSRTAAVKLVDAIAAGSSKVGEAARVVAAGVGGWTQERKKLLRKVFAPSREPSTGSSISMPTQCTAGSRQSSSGYCHDP
mmetsp:Transcript_11100/g.35393  ORF Transcript_11100/g.35393 Transcript_11100/m.35393 type:complete len:252 (-) Transcript_11100:137-892(-)